MDFLAFVVALFHSLYFKALSQWVTTRKRKYFVTEVKKEIWWKIAQFWKHQLLYEKIALIMTETLLSKKQTCALQSEHIVFLLLKKVAVKSILNVC